MGDTNTQSETRREDIIAAFDREREQAREWSRRHAEQIRDSHARNRPVYIERRRYPR